MLIGEDGQSEGTAEIEFVEVAGDDGSIEYKLDRAFIKSWSTSGDADDRPTEETEDEVHYYTIDLQDATVSEISPEEVTIAYEYIVRQFEADNGDVFGA